MSWNAFLLALVGIYAAYKTARFAHVYHSLKYLSYSLGAVAFVVAETTLLVQSILLNYGINFNAEFIVELSTITALSFILSGLAVFIRESKPVFAQFPLVYAGLPLLLILSYLIVRNSVAIKDWLMSIYQGGALLVAFLMYGIHSLRNSYFTYTLYSIILFAITFCFYWFVPAVQSQYIWVCQLFLGISVIVAIYGLQFSIQNAPQKHKNLL